MSEPVRFGDREPPFGLGVEEELFLVDPVTGDQADASAAVVGRLGETAGGHVERELHACQVEGITDVCVNAGEAVATLRRLRGAVLDTGAGLLASGTHPRALEGEAAVTDKERYAQVRELLGDGAADPVGGLHVHVGMPDAASAVRAYNGLRRDLPLLQALAANSPFRHGRDTGLASARDLSMRGWARSGVPRAVTDFEDFQAMAARLARAAEVPDYTWFWWKLRPHPRLGTVELRALDVQTSTEDLEVVVALVHALGRFHATTEPDGPDPPAELLEEGSFRAGRFGVRGTLPDADGTPRPVADLAHAAVARAAEHADDLGCRAAVDAVADLVRRGGGAARQRDLHALGGMPMLLRELTALSAAGVPRAT